MDNDIFTKVLEKIVIQVTALEATNAKLSKRVVYLEDQMHNCIEAVMKVGAADELEAWMIEAAKEPAFDVRLSNKEIEKGVATYRRY
jgi:hypothetical protein